MADRGFFVGFEFREGAARNGKAGLGELEQGVVAKVVRAARRGQDAAVCGALDLERDAAVRAAQAQRADKARGALVGGDAGEVGEQFEVVRVVVAVGAGVARGADAGCAA